MYSEYFVFSTLFSILSYMFISEYVCWISIIKLHFKYAYSFDMCTMLIRYLCADSCADPCAQQPGVPEHPSLHTIQKALNNAIYSIYTNE